MTAPAPFQEAEDRGLKAEAVAKMSAIRSSRNCLRSSAFSRRSGVLR
jgi:hypothetical protein